MTFLEKSLNNLPEDMKAELSGVQELSLDDLDSVAGGANNPVYCCICNQAYGTIQDAGGNYYCEDCYKYAFSKTM